MTTRLVQDGDAIELTAPTAGYTAGQVVNKNGLICVIMETCAGSAKTTALTRGVFTLTKKAGASNALLQGEVVFLSATGAVIPATATGAVELGRAWAAAATGATTAPIAINISGGA